MNARAARQSLGTLAATLVLVAVAASCGTGATGPVALDTSRDTCSSCRMIVSNARFASQLVVPYEEPRFFDDLGCLARYLASTSSLPAGARVYVADHRTGAWVAAEHALYARVETLSAPMGSHIVAHESVESRVADASAGGGTPVDLDVVFAGHLPAERTR